MTLLYLGILLPITLRYIGLKLLNDFTWGQTEKVLPLVFYFNITPLP